LEKLNCVWVVVFLVEIEERKRKTRVQTKLRPLWTSSAVEKQKLYEGDTET